MKRLLILLALLLSHGAMAAGLGLEFKNITVPQLSQAVLKGILHRGYVLSPAVLAQEERFSVSVNYIDDKQVLPLLEAILTSQGIAITELESGVLFLDVVPPTPQAGKGAASPEAPQLATPEIIDVYRPKFRSVEFLRSALVFTGVQVIPQNDPDVLVFGGTPEQMGKARALLRSVDFAVSGVNIRAVLLEVTESSDESRSLSGVLSLLSGKLGIQLSGGARLQNYVSFKNTTLTAVLSALEGDSRFKYVAEPSLGVLDGQEARLVVGSEEPVRGALKSDNNGNMVQSIEYRTAGVVISVTPRIYAEFISLKVNQELSSFKATSTSSIDSPTILKRQSSTVIDAKEGEVIVLAGLDESRDSRTSEGLSWLPAFMRSTSHSSNRSQVLLMMEVQRRI